MLDLIAQSPNRHPVVCVCLHPQAWYLDTLSQRNGGSEKRKNEFSLSLKQIVSDFSRVKIPTVIVASRAHAPKELAVGHYIEQNNRRVDLNNEQNTWPTLHFMSLAGISPALVKARENIIVQNANDAFRRSFEYPQNALTTLLDTWQTKTIAFVGIHTTACMADTLDGALNTRAYECQVLYDHIADGTRGVRPEDDLNPEWHRAYLEEHFGRNRLFKAVTRAAFFSHPRQP